MSDVNSARRTAVQVSFAGVNITKSITPYLLQLTYTDNEEDETDDLQIKLQDTEGLWVEKWLNTMILSDAGISASSSTETYTVTASKGVNVRSGKGTKYSKLGTLAYGASVKVQSVSGDWAKITYSGKTGYVHTDYIKKKESTTTSSEKVKIGDEVTVTGQPQYSSYGTGTPGAKVTNYKGKVTRLNRKSGIKYPVHVGYLGWFSDSQVTKTGTTTKTETVKTAQKGLKISASILRENWNNDGKDDLLDCGQFELDSVVAQGPPDTVTIKGTSLPYSSSVRQTEKSKSWENYTLKGILSEIASKNHMSYMFSSDNNPSYKRLEQYKKSDIAFLQKLCRDAGCSLKVTNNIIVVFEQATYEKKSTVLTLKKGSGSYERYSLKTAEDDTYTSCKVSWTTSSGNCISGTAYVEDYDEDDKNNQCLKITQKVSSVAEAKALAEKLLKLHNKYELTATFTVPGNPKLLAGCTVALSGWGAWDGKYIIKQAKHSVGTGGYTTALTLRKVI